MRSCDVPVRFIVVSEAYSFDDDQAELLIKVEVACAIPERQLIVPLNVLVGTTGLEEYGNQTSLSNFQRSISIKTL